MKSPSTRRLKTSLIALFLFAVGCSVCPNYPQLHSISGSKLAHQMRGDNMGGTKTMREMYLRLGPGGKVHVFSFNVHGKVDETKSLCNKAILSTPRKVTNPGLTCTSCAKKLQLVPKSILAKLGLEEWGDYESKKSQNLRSQC